jgi:hypothetical protein
MPTLPLRCSVLALLLALPALAQTTPTNLSAALAQACAVQPLDGSLWAGGPAYKAEFRADAVEFTPALGKLAPRNFPLSLSLSAVGRGEELQATGTVAPEHTGLQVRYRHALCELRYDATPAGLEQSLVFAALPAGSGDLRIRFAVRTDLPLVATADRGLQFEVAGLGGVSIGTVTGIDANGERCTGAITCSGGAVELRLPAAFVQRAALPLLVDPLIGTTFAVTNSTFDYQAPDLCAAVPGVTLFLQQALAVFERQISATDRDIRAFYLRSDGTVSGSLLLVTSSTALDTAPAVGRAVSSQHFVVVYERGGYLLARSVPFVAGVPGTEVTVVATADTMGAPDLGSELTTTDNDVLCVYRNVTQDRIQAQQISCTTAGVLAAFAPVTLATAAANSDFGRPRISHDGGTVGNYLIVYPRSPLFGGTQLQGIVVNRNLAVQATTALTTDSAQDHDSPSVDGDGSDWVVAFDQEPALTTSDTDIRALPVGFSAQSGLLVVGTGIPVASTASLDETEPAVTYVGSTCLVGWRRQAAAGSLNTNIFCRTVDLFTCSVCEVSSPVASTADIERGLAVANVQGKAVLLWETSDPATANGDIDGALFAPEDGAASSLGPRCGNGGFVRASCARVGNANFQVRLRSAQPAASAWLVLSTTPEDIDCGPCSLRADPWSGVLFGAVAADAHGHALQAVPIPAAAALQNLPLVAQWIVGSTAGQCPVLNTDFSSSLAFRLQ